MWYVYIIRCNDGSLYTGCTTDPQRRFIEHSSGGHKSARRLRGRGPLQLVYTAEAGNTRSEAQSLESKIKKMSKSEKEALL